MIIIITMIIIMTIINKIEKITIMKVIMLSDKLTC